MFVGRHPPHQIGSCGTEKCLKGVQVERLSGCEKGVFIAAHLRNPFQGKYQPLVPPHHCLVSNLFSLCLFSFIGSLAHYKSVDQYSERSD